MPTTFSKIPIGFWIFDNPHTHRRYLMFMNKIIKLLSRRWHFVRKSKFEFIR